MIVANVQLCDLRASVVSCVFDVERNDDRLIEISSVRRHLKVVVGEGRVRKTVAEREERFHAGTIKMPVPQENALRVFDLLLSRLRVITVERSIVFPLALERCGELARRTVFAEQDLRQRGPPSCPGYQASMTPGTRLIHCLISTLPPDVITTMVFWFWLLIWRIRSV